MRREQLTEKFLDIKRAKGWSWKHITTAIGGVSPVLIVGALLGQMKLVKPLAKKAAALFGLSETEERMLNEVPNRGTPMPPTDPLISARDRETATGFAGQTCRGWGTREKGNVGVNW